MANTISIVTCSYQQSRYLDATMRSVLDQNYANLEYIIVDGGSSDNSTEIIKKYEDRLAYWVSERDRGQTDALIKGFKRSTGEILGWLCSDDLLLPGALERINKFFLEHPQVNAVYGDALWIDQYGNLIRPKKEMSFNRFVFLYDHNYIPQPSMFWRRSLYERVGGLNESFNLAMDSDLWDRFSAITKIAYLPDYLSCMRFYPEQKTRSMKSRGRQEDAIIRARHGPVFSDSLYPVLRMGARTIRIAHKLLTGCYSTKVPPYYLDSLDNYLIKENSK